MLIQSGFAMLAIANMSAARKRHPEIMVSLSISDEVYLPWNWKVKRTLQTDPNRWVWSPFHLRFYRVCVYLAPSNRAPVTGLVFPYFLATLRRNTALTSTGEVQYAFHLSAGENAVSHIRGAGFVLSRTPNEQIAQSESVGPRLQLLFS